TWSLVTTPWVEPGGRQYARILSLRISEDMTRWLVIARIGLPDWVARKTLNQVSLSAMGSAAPEPVTFHRTDAVTLWPARRPKSASRSRPFSAMVILPFTIADALAMMMRVLMAWASSTASR